MPGLLGQHIDALPSARGGQGLGELRCCGSGGQGLCAFIAVMIMIRAPLCSFASWGAG
jgi:hypothetical protein